MGPIPLVRMTLQRAFMRSSIFSAESLLRPDIIQVQGSLLAPLGNAFDQGASVSIDFKCLHDFMVRPGYLEKLPLSSGQAVSGNAFHVSIWSIEKETVLRR